MDNIYRNNKNLIMNRIIEKNAAELIVLTLTLIIIFAA